jgi:hypothetical protein
MLVAALYLVGRYGSNVPSWDDWDMVPTLTGEQPVTAEWLWSQHNEHRVPLPRLALLALGRLVALDFRVPMVVDALAMGAAAAGLVAAAIRLRGRASLTDAFLPLVLLNWSHAANLLWAWQIEYFASVVLSCVALRAIALCGTSLAPRAAGIRVGTCLLLLPLTGGNGLAMAPAWIGWLGYAAWLTRRRGGPNAGPDAALLAAFAAAGAGLLGFYFVGWQPVPWHPRSYDLLWSLKNTWKFVTVGMGPAASDAWHLSSRLALAIFASTGALLATVWWRRPEERCRAAGLLSFLAGMALLALAIGAGREGFEIRYVTLSVPAWCGVYLVWTLYAPGRLGASARGVLLAAALAALWPNTRAGLSYARELRGNLAAFQRDLAAGVPIHELVRRHGDWLHPHHDVVMEYLPMLRRAGLADYRPLRDDPTFREIPVRLEAARLHEVRWSDHTAELLGYAPSLEFDLPRDLFVEGIRLRYQYRDPQGDFPFVGLAWKRSDQAEFPANPFKTGPGFKKYSPTGDRANWERGTWTRIHDPATTVTAWVGDTVGQLRLTPNFRPGTFHIVELVLLVPAD